MTKKKTDKKDTSKKPTQTEIDGAHYELCWQLISEAKFEGKDSPKVAAALQFLDNKHTACAKAVEQASKKDD